MDIPQSHIDTIKHITFLKIINFLDSEGITITHDYLNKNIHINSSDINNHNQNKVKKLKFKPKSKPQKKLKFKPKPKSTKLNDYNSFIQICNSNNLTFFQFYDEHNWTGPTTKIDDHLFTKYITLFNNFDYTIINGTDFKLIRPTQSHDDSHIIYKPLSPPMIHSTTSYNSDNENSQHNDNSEIDENDIISTEDWEYRNIIYELDTQTNNLYSNLSIVDW